MLKEFVEKIEELTTEGAKPEIFKIDQNDFGTAQVWNPQSGSFQQFDLNRPKRQHQVTTLQSLAGAYARYAVDMEPSIWITLSTVAVILDDNADGYRIDRITLPVAPSPLFELLTRLPNTQKQLINALRHDLRPSGIEPASFELSIANLRWEVTDTTEGNYGTVKSTMGRQVNAEVKSGGDIPPEISVTFQPFPALANDLQCEVSVDCSVTVDATEKTISVRPFPGQLDMAKAVAVEALRAKVTELLAADQTKVFAGTP